MDNKMLAREMLKDFQANFAPHKRMSKCPFKNPAQGDNNHELCALLFPSWAKKFLDGKGLTLRCPCYAMSQPYVRHRARKFVKEGK